MVKRFSVKGWYDDQIQFVDPDGKWVHYSDYAALEAELAEKKRLIEIALRETAPARDEANKRAELAEARLAEALKALKPFASVALLDQTPDAPRGMWVSVPFGWLQDARRVREGGKEDG